MFCDMWDLPRSGIELVSPELAGRFFTPQPTGKPQEFEFLTLKPNVLFSYFYNWTEWHSYCHT